jgi:hypothetical protein
MFNLFNINGINQYVFKVGSIEFPDKFYANPKIINLDSLVNQPEECPIQDLIMDKLIELKINSHVIDCFAKQ